MPPFMMLDLASFNNAFIPSAKYVCTTTMESYRISFAPVDWPAA